MAIPTPGPHDYLVEHVGAGQAAPVWTITQDGAMRRTYESQDFAFRMVRHFARMSGCRTWLIVSGAAPLLLTLELAHASVVTPRVAAHVGV